MPVISRNISKVIRDALRDHLIADSYIAATFLKGGVAYIYDKPFETVTVSRYPALSVYDTLARDYDYPSQFHRTAEELFKIEVIAQNVDWTVAKNNCSLYIDTVEMLIDQIPWVSKSVPILDVTIDGVRPIGGIEINRMWTVGVEMDILIEYEKGYEPDN